MKHDVLILHKDVDEKDISWYIYDKVSDQPWISVPTCHKNVKMYSGWHNWHIEEHRQSSCRFDRNSLFIVCQLDDLFINGSSTELILQQSNNDRKSILKLCFLSISFTQAWWHTIQHIRHYSNCVTRGWHWWQEGHLRLCERSGESRWLPGRKSGGSLLPCRPRGTPGEDMCCNWRTNTFVNENDVCQLLCGLTAEWCMILVQLLDWIKQHLCWDEWRSNISNSVHFISDYAQCPWGARHLWGDIVVWGTAGVGGKGEGIPKCSRRGGWGRGAGGGWERHGEQGVHQAGGDESWKRRTTSMLIVY